MKNNEYFAEAKKWYANKYFSAYTQLLYCFITTIFLVVITTISIMLTLKQKKTIIMPFPIYVNSSFYKHNLKELNENSETLNQAITKYLIKYYINLRENYRPDMLDEYVWKTKLYKIRNISSKYVFKQYVDEYNTENFNSPFIKYAYVGKRNVTITNIELDKNIYNPSSATVYFTATEEWNDDKVTTNWKVKINFTLLELKEKNTINFLIINYQPLKILSNNEVN